MKKIVGQVRVERIITKIKNTPFGVFFIFAELSGKLLP